MKCECCGQEIGANINELKDDILKSSWVKNLKKGFKKLTKKTKKAKAEE